MVVLPSGYLMERREKTKRLKRDRLLRYSRMLFLAFIIFCREFNVPSLFPFQFLISLQFHVVFMIHSFLFLAFGHNSSSLRTLYSVPTSIKLARALWSRLMARIENRIEASSANNKNQEETLLMIRY